MKTETYGTNSLLKTWKKTPNIPLVSWTTVAWRAISASLLWGECDAGKPSSLPRITAKGSPPLVGPQHREHLLPPFTPTGQGWCRRQFSMTAAQREPYRKRWAGRNIHVRKTLISTLESSTRIHGSALETGCSRSWKWKHWRTKLHSSRRRWQVVVRASAGCCKQVRDVALFVPHTVWHAMWGSWQQRPNYRPYKSIIIATRSLSKEKKCSIQLG